VLGLLIRRKREYACAGNMILSVQYFVLKYQMAGARRIMALRYYETVMIQSAVRRITLCTKQLRAEFHLLFKLKGFQQSSLQSLKLEMKQRFR
jgi:hypothetical protein